jgi:hypothetical protein
LIAAGWLARRGCCRPYSQLSNIGCFQGIELVDGDGRSRFEKLTIDFDEDHISRLVRCIMVFYLASKKSPVGHCSWHHEMQLCAVALLSYLFPHCALSVQE